VRPMNPQPTRPMLSVLFVLIPVLDAAVSHARRDLGSP
jgi:hypothetical protein